MNITPTVKQLLIINILMFVGTIFVPQAKNILALFYFENPMFKFWQPITHMFLHHGFMHLFFNMFALYSFGSTLEHFWGGKKFLYFYIACGLGAAFLYTAVNYYDFNFVGNLQVFNSVAVGASGAVYGLLVAFAFMFPNAELALMFIPVPIKAKYFVPGIVALDLFLGFKGDSIFGSGGTGIAHFAHVGGAAVGYLLMKSWKDNQFNKNRWDT